MAPIHPEVVRSSAASYLSYLDALIVSGQLTQSGDVAAHALRDSLEKLLDPTSHRRTGIPFNANLLSPCTADERSALVNQWALGVGNDGARVVFMGTEHAYDIDTSPVGLALESCGSPLLWLDYGGPELAAFIAQDPDWVKQTGRSYHRHPSDHYPVGSGHTWRTVARVVGVPLGDLGEHAYQVDRSAHPARKATDGAPPTSERREFLVQLLQAFRSSARVLVLHGKTAQSGDEWEACNRALTETFMNQADLDEPEVRHVGKASIRWWTADGRTVVHTWALNGAALAHSGASSEYVSALAELVRAGMIQ